MKENFLYNEPELLLRIAQGDETAFRNLFDAYRDFVYSFALKMTHSETAAKDITQDIFIKLWLQKEMLRTVDNLSGYINRLTRNHTINGLKRKAFEEVLTRSLPPTAGDISTESEILHRELQRLLHQAVQQLPPQQQKVYELSRQQGLTHAEIASQLRISKETVKKHLMAALKNIQQYINAQNALGWLAFCLLY